MGNILINIKDKSKKNVLKNRTDVLAHRDPDDEGYYINSSNAGKRNSKWKFGKGGGVDSSVLGSPDVNPCQNLSIKRK